MGKVSAEEKDPAVIPLVDVASLDPQTKALHDRIEASIGFVPNSMKTYLHRPSVAGALLGLSAGIYGVDEDSLPASVQAKLGVICSAINGCAYCTSHQCSALQNPAAHAAQASGLSDAEIEALISGKAEGSDPVEKACIAYARAASFDPNSVPEELLEDLKSVLSSGQIVQLAAIVGMWKLFNTIHDSLKIPIEDEKQPYRHFFDDAR